MRKELHKPSKQCKHTCNHHLTVAPDPSGMNEYHGVSVNIFNDYTLKDNTAE